MMDHISHHTFNNPYYIPLMEDHHHHHGGADFDPQQWLHHYHQQNDPSISSSSSQFLTATSDPANLLPLHSNFREEQSTTAAGNDAEDETEEEELGAMKEMMFKIAAMQPVDIDPATMRKPRRRNVRISNDPQSVAARHRRERISEKIRILQRLVPGGTKMDTASMLDEAIRYVKFLKRQIRILQAHPHPNPPPCIPLATPPPPEDWTGATTAAVAAPPSPYLFGGNNNAGNSSRPYELL